MYVGQNRGAAFRINREVRFRHRRDGAVSTDPRKAPVNSALVFGRIREVLLAVLLADGRWYSNGTWRVGLSGRALSGCDLCRRGELAG